MCSKNRVRKKERSLKQINMAKNKIMRTQLE